MKLEYINLNDFLSNNTFLKKGDYLYKHDKNVYPLQNEIDIANLFFVTNSIGHQLTICNMSTSSINKVNLSTTAENWWLLPLPKLIRQQIGLE